MEQLLRRKEVERLVAICTTSLYQKIREGKFPHPIKIASTAVRWKLSEIQAWIDAQPRSTI